MKIIKLVAENFKGIKAIEIEPKSNMVKIKGKNGSGKSSILDAIESALRGGRFSPDQAVRIGTEKANIEIEVGEGDSKLFIKREFDKAGASLLKVSGADGKKIKGARSMLDALAGNLSYDPMEFLQLKPMERFNMLRKVCNLDFTEEDKIIEETEPLRTIAFREKKGAEHALKKLESVEEYIAPSIHSVLEAKKAAEEKNKKIEFKRGELDHKERKLTDLIERKIPELDASIVAIEDEIARLEETIKKHKEDIKSRQIVQSENVAYSYTLKNQIQVEKDSLEKDPEMQIVDTSEFYKKLEDHQANVEREQSYKEKLKREKDFEDCVGKWEELDGKIWDARKSKIEKIKAAKMPVDGLSLDLETNEILYCGVLFSQVNTASQIDISTRIAMSLNPKLKVIRIKNGSLMDSETTHMIEEIAEQSDYQIWVEEISEGLSEEDGSFYVYEGELK